MTKSKGLKRFTLLVIPEPQRSVMHFRISKWLLMILPTLLISVTVYIMLYLHFNSIWQTRRLELEMSQQSKAQGLTLSQKNSTIEQLQSEVITLAEKAEQVGRKLDQLSALEAEVKQFLGEHTSTSSTPREPLNHNSSNQGGELFPPDNASILHLAATIQTNFTSLNTLLDSIQDSLSSTLQTAEHTAHQLAITPTYWPTSSYSITSGFGYRSDPFTKRPSLHKGIDIDGDLGDPVYTAAEGKIIYSGYDTTHGQQLIIEHSPSLQTVYMHLSKRAVSVGGKVHKGQYIGRVGSTGRSTGAHLHFEILVRGVQINPLKYMNDSREDESNAEKQED